jgi:PPM family protein phosphatase
MTLALRYTVQSDVGLLREGNEDSAYAGPHLLAIADGMGGHAAGEVASAVAISTVAPLDTDMTGVDMLQVLADAIAEANAELRQVTLTDPSTEGMGTTLTALLWSGEEEFALCHIGDSRGYLLRDGVFHRISHDHTLVQSLVDEGRLTPEAAATHPQRSLVMRALQSSVPAEPDLAIIKAKVGDRYLLCSDGLTDVVSDDTVGKTLGEISDLDEAVAKLIDLAIRGGGPDNITCVLADVIDTDSGQQPSSESIVVGALLGDEQDAEPVRTDSPAARARLLTLGSRTGEAPGPTAGADGAHAGPGASDPGAQTVAGTTASGGTGADGTAADAGQSGMVGNAVLTGSASEDDEDDEDEDEDDDRALSRRGRRRWPVVSTTLVILLAVVCGGGYLFWRFTQSEYFVGTADGRVVVFRGVNDAVVGVHLSSMVQKTDIPINGVPTGEAGQIKATIPAGTLQQAHQIVSRIRRDYTCASVQADIRTWAAHRPTPTPDKSPAGFGSTSATRLNSKHHASGPASHSGSKSGSKSGSGKTPKPKSSPSPSPSPKPSSSYRPEPVLPRYCPAYPAVPG